MGKKNKIKDTTSRPGLSSQVAAVDEREFLRDRSLIENRIKMTYPDAEGFTYEPGISNSIVGNAYYIEFESKELEPNEAYYFCLVDKNKVEAFDSEEDLLHHALVLMDRRRNAWQKFGDVTISDVLALLVAIVLSAVLLVETAKLTELKDFSKEIIALFGIIVGYLFGRKS